MRVDDFTSRLEGVKKGSGGWIARCPAHQDRQQSLKVDEGKEGEILVRCHAGCDTEAVVRAMGLEMKDLFPEKEREPESRLVKTYDYVDEAGELLYQVCRYEPKSFRQRKPNDSGDWDWKLGEVRRVLYRLPALLEAIAAGKPVWIPEGEKDVDALVEAGVEGATTNVGGAQAWRSEYTELLVSSGVKVVVIVADRDGPGVKRARKLAAELTAAGIERVVLVQAKEGKDAYDHLSAGFGPKDFEPLDEEEPTDGLVVQKFSKVDVEPPEWVNGFENFIPFGAITLLAGEQGTNKSTLACQIAGIVNGFHDGDVLYITTEGDPAIEIKPRLLVAGANEERCHFVKKRVGGFDDIVFFPTDIRDLEAEVRRLGVKLVVIDPALAHVDVEDTNNDSSIRTALAPLQMLAQRNRCVVLLIAHINKDKSNDPFKRVGGSKGLTGVARSNLLMAQSPDGDDLRVLASFKNSWGPEPKSRVLRVQSVLVPGADVYTARTFDFGHSGLTAKHLLSERRREQ